MASGELVTALVALVVSAVALVATFAQLLAQIVGTVEGLRRCRHSVMANWANKAKRVWHWREFRFETVFSTPEIVLMPYDPRISDQRLALTGYKDSIQGSYVSEDWSELDSQRHHLVSWVPLLFSLHENIAPISEKLVPEQPHSRQPLHNTSWPAICFRQRSWDLMPPDIVRPFATTFASDIAVLACRMGVRWKDFRPAEAIMEGEGGGHTFSATKVLGVGTILNYTKIPVHSSPSERDRQNPVSPTNLWVCTPEADMMWFGMLPGNNDFALKTYHIGTIQEVYLTLQTLDPQGVAVEALRETQRRQTGLLHGFCDIVPMFAPWLRQPCTVVNEYPRPLGGTLGLTWYCVAYRVFKEELTRYNSTRGTTQTRRIQHIYEDLSTTYGKEWDGVSNGLRDRSVEFYDTLETQYNETTAYFTGRLNDWEYANNRRWETSHYIDLVCAHLRQAPRSFVDGEREVREGRGHHDALNTEGDKYWRSEAMYYYWCYLPDYVRFMRGKGCEDAQLVEEAWITLIFRAFLWQRAHIPVQNEPSLPSRFYGSQLPVYIG